MLTIRSSALKETGRMKIVHLLVAIGFATVVSPVAWAQDAVPPYLAFTGELSDNANHPVTDLVDMRFSLYEAESGGDPLWQEMQNNIAVTEGRFTAYLGAQNPVDPSLFDGAERWIGVAINGAAELQPRRRLVSVPYAMQAGTCEQVGGHTIEDFLLVGDPIPAESLTGAVPQCGNSDTLDGVHAADLEESQEIIDAIADLNLQVNSVDGLQGGTIHGNVTISGDLSVTGAVTEDGQEVCHEGGNCGGMLSTLGCQAGEVAVSVGANQWACRPFPSAPTQACNGNWQVMQWNGTQFVCSTLQGTGLSGGRANGFELTDSWDFAWDGLMRPPRSWTDANAMCTSLGGRLPTPTEVYRVANHALGTAEIGDLNETNALWTLIPHDSQRYVTVRLSDGSTGSTVATDLLPFRCVWNETVSGQFEGNACFGPAGDECWLLTGHGGRFSVDTYDRPALNFNSAMRECAFYHAQLASEMAYTEAIRLGLPNGSNSWLHTADQHTTNDTDFFVGVVKWTGADPDFTDLGPDDSGTAVFNASTKRPFRCMGLNVLVAIHPVTLANEWVDPNTRLKSTAVDETALPFGEAISACRTRGGHLPAQQELMSLIQAGLPGGTNEWLWTADQQEGDAVGVVRWTGEALQFTGFQADGGTAYSSKTVDIVRPFRCVYYPLDSGYSGPQAAQCNPSCWSQTVNNGAALTVWSDTFDRVASDYVSAIDACYALDGHLASERDMVELIRAGLPNGYTLRLWTADTTGADLNSTVAWQGSPGTGFADTETDQSDDRDRTGAFQYRCVWRNELYVP